MVPHKRTDAGDRSPLRTERVVGGLWGGRTRDDPRRRKRDRLRWVGVQVLGEGAEAEQECRPRAAGGHAGTGDPGGGQTQGVNTGPGWGTLAGAGSVPRPVCR